MTGYGIGKIALIATTIFISLHASAATYSNLDSGVGGIGYLGSAGATSYGETFTTTGGILRDFTFYSRSGPSGNVSLTIAAWDGSRAIGPALYASSPISYVGGEQSLGASGINLALLANTSYVAYLTVADVALPVQSAVMKYSNGDGGLPGQFVFSFSNGADPLKLNSPWGNLGGLVPHLTYTAHITAVPEPETYAMLLGGLGLFGAIARRRKQA